MKTSSIPDTGKIISIAYLLGFVVVLVIVYKLLAAVGIIKTAKARKTAAAKVQAVTQLRTEDYFSPTYYKDKKFKSIGSNAANLYAQNLRKAVRGWGTDEESIFSTFGKLYNKCNISEVSEKYYLQYGRDLQTDLLDDLTDKETVELMDIVNSLPNT
jgi:hypothetical protein